MEIVWSLDFTFGLRILTLAAIAWSRSA